MNQLSGSNEDTADHMTIGILKYKMQHKSHKLYKVYRISVDLLQINNIKKHFPSLLCESIVV